MTTEMTTASVDTDAVLNEYVLWDREDGSIRRLYATEAFSLSGAHKLEWEQLSNGLWRTVNTPKNAMNLPWALDTTVARRYRAGTESEFAAFVERTVRARAQVEAQAAQTRTMAQNGGPATERQLAYLVSLGVDIPADYQLTKYGASDIIDAVKRGDGVGRFGLYFTDGSN